MSKVRVAKYLPDPIDGHMGIHQLRNHPAFRTLQPGEVGVAFNWNRRICKIVTAARGVYTMYADEGYQFDFEAVKQHIADGWMLDLQGNRHIEKDLRDPVDEAEVAKQRRRLRAKRAAKKGAKR